MPHVFKAILVALAQPTLEVALRQQGFARYRDFRPGEFPWTLRRALQGETVPVVRLRAALKYRQVPFYRQASLAMSGDEPFLQMALALPQLFRRMGYRGWVLLFDEGEAISQVRRPQRARSYRILHRLLYPDSPPPGFYPVFAFTPDFFQRLQDEDYGLPEFDRDYAQAWRQLSIYQLRALSQADCCGTFATPSSRYMWQPMAGMPTVNTCCHGSQRSSPPCPCRTHARPSRPWSMRLDHVHQQKWFAQQAVRHT